MLQGNKVNYKIHIFHYLLVINTNTVSEKFVSFSLIKSLIIIVIIIIKGTKKAVAVIIPKIRLELIKFFFINGSLQ